MDEDDELQRKKFLSVWKTHKGIQSHLSRNENSNLTYRPMIGARINAQRPSKSP